MWWCTSMASRYTGVSVSRSGAVRSPEVCTVVMGHPAIHRGPEWSAGQGKRFSCVPDRADGHPAADRLDHLARGHGPDSPVQLDQVAAFVVDQLDGDLRGVGLARDG